MVVTFCDGRVDFLDEGIDIRVFMHLLTPNSKRAVQTAVEKDWPFFTEMLVDPEDPESGITVLDEGDY